MAEKYINAYKLKLEINVMLSGERKTGNHNTAQHALKSVRKMIDYFPAADVEPVRHGHIIWKRRRRGGFRHAKCLHRFCNFVIEDNAPCKHIAKIDERYTIYEPYCSECGKLLGDFLNYCGNCGARMDGDTDANGNDNKTPET